MNQLDIFGMIASSFGIPLLLVDRDFQQIQEMDFGFRKQYYPQNPYEALRTQLEKSLQENTILYFKDEFDVYYYAFLLPDSRYAFIGPFRYEETEIQPSESAVAAYLKTVPTIKEIFPLQSLLTKIFAQLYPGKGFLFLAGDLQVPSSLFHRDSAFSVKMAHDYPEQATAAGWKTGLLIQEVSAGNTPKALEYVRDLLAETQRYQDLEQFRRYQLLAFEINVLLKHTAYENKVYSHYCESIYERYLKKIAAASRVIALEDICYDMVSAYTLMLREHAHKAKSPLIKDCLNYIDMHFTENITLTSEASRLSVCASYLSSLFQKETGEALMNYINRRRIQYACILLEKMQLSIQRVAEISGFSSSNYFARVFKKTMGISPREFRKNMQKP